MILGRDPALDKCLSSSEVGKVRGYESVLGLSADLLAAECSCARIQLVNTVPRGTLSVVVGGCSTWNTLAQNLGIAVSKPLG